MLSNAETSSNCVVLGLAPGQLPVNRMSISPVGIVAAESGSSALQGTSESERRREARLRDWVDRYLDVVARVLRNGGTPEAEIDDAVQRTFIVASNRMNDIRLGAEKSFLIQTALNVAAHARRTLARRREVSVEQAPEMIDRFTPEQLTDQKRARQLLDRLLDTMDGDLRTVFVLYEFEQLNTSEIAATLGIPRGTVASRLRRARATFQARVAEFEASETRKVLP